MNNDLVFNIKNIFDANSPKGALSLYEAKKYYIAPYQRGYKWAAVSPNDPVCKLITDLVGAANDRNSDYYLQFITTKSSTIGEGEDKESVLEVIDGQQRLTTLTILLSVIEYIKGDNEKAISNGLLSYEVRQRVTDFFQNHIYQKLDSLMSGTWKDFIEQYPENDEQDIYYLYSAAQKIKKILDEEFPAPSQKEKIIRFKEYLLDKVKILLICITREIDCEEIFSNLNDNRVELTSSELVKGLILTDVARRQPNTEETYNGKEKSELRAIIGRQWDEISHWANRKDIRKFFFQESDNVLDELLLILANVIAMDLENQTTLDTSSKNGIFNYFQLQIKNHKKTARDIFRTLKEIKSVFYDWFYDDEIYNSLGYLFFRRNSPRKVNDYRLSIRENKPELKEKLKKDICSSLNVDIDNIRYKKDDDNIRDLLLAISVFSDGNRFNFIEFNDQTWSLEHIFPQTPDECRDGLRQKDIDLLKSLCDENLCGFEKAQDLLLEYEEIMDIKSVYNSLSEKLNCKLIPNEICNLSFDEIKILYSLINRGKLDGIGNMALLTKSDNSSNSNGMFDKKRLNIVNRISKGSFVPKHTYDVFSKLISKKMTPDLTVWTIDDITAHSEWIKEWRKNKIHNLQESKLV